MRRAFISVSDKTGVVEFAKELVELGFEIVSTGGTAAALQKAGIPIIPVSDVTGFPECLDGRVKTLHPKVHAGILAMRSNEEHMRQLEKLDVTPIDIVAVNLYPFKETILKPDVTFADAIENIDIGGPTMLRAAAKNYQDVAVIVEAQDYSVVIEELKEFGEVTLKTKMRLCRNVFEHTAAYDSMIISYLREQAEIHEFPGKFTITFEKVQNLRYGENPHQRAAYYKEVGNRPECLHEAEQLSGGELSFNNIDDADQALQLLKEFEETTVVAVKHTNPCGVATGETVLEAYQKAHSPAMEPIYGGIVAMNRTVDEATAREMLNRFVELVIAPDYTEEALAVLCTKKSLRVLKLPGMLQEPRKSGWDFKRIAGGLLLQDTDRELLKPGYEIVTKRQPSEQEMRDLMIAWKVAKHVKSNATVMAKDGMALGIGAGETKRIWSIEQAIERSGIEIEGAVMATDAILPSDDCVEAAARAGVRCIIQPGGSIRDDECVMACDLFGMSMIFTDMRHFKH